MEQTPRNGLGVLIIGVIAFIIGLIISLVDSLNSITLLNLISSILTPLSTVPISLGIVLIYERDSDKD